MGNTDRMELKRGKRISNTDRIEQERRKTRKITSL